LFQLIRNKTLLIAVQDLPVAALCPRDDRNKVGNGEKL